jgi:hypothetical protein
MLKTCVPLRFKFVSAVRCTSCTARDGRTWRNRAHTHNNTHTRR